MITSTFSICVRMKTGVDARGPKKYGLFWFILVHGSAGFSRVFESCPILFAALRSGSSIR